MSPLIEQPLESFTFGAKGIKGLLEQEAVSFSIEADVECGSVVDKVNRQIKGDETSTVFRDRKWISSDTKKLSFVQKGVCGTK